MGRCNCEVQCRYIFFFHGLIDICSKMKGLFVNFSRNFFLMRKLLTACSKCVVHNYHNYHDRGFTNKVVKLVIKRIWHGSRWYMIFIQQSCVSIPSSRLGIENTTCQIKFIYHRETYEVSYILCTYTVTIASPCHLYDWSTRYNSVISQ